MIYTEKQLNDIEELSSILLGVLDIATYLELPFEDFKADLEDTSSDAFLAHKKGFLKTVIANRQRLIRDSDSSPESNLKVIELIQEYNSLNMMQKDA